MCVDTTKIEENRIKASIQLKFTDCKTIYDSVVRNVHESQLKHMVPADLLRYKISTMDKPEEVQNQYHALVDADTDLLLYVHLYMEITFDDYSRKITMLHFHGSLSDVYARN